jgi:hypothetical protein
MKQNHARELGFDDRTSLVPVYTLWGVEETPFQQVKRPLLL